MIIDSVFRRKYEDAVANDKESFIHNGRVFWTLYAKYLIEFQQLKGKK